MRSIIRDKLDELAAICRRRRVLSRDLFGSAASGAFDPATSDLDFLVEFLPFESGSDFDNCFDLLDDLESLFGRPVDLVAATAISNRYLLESVNRSRSVLCAA